MSEERDPINLLRHYRHDWLNRLQLISGYIDIGDVSKAREVINETINAAQNESKLSNLNIPGFAEDVLTFNWKGYSFTLQCDVVCETVWTGYDRPFQAFFRELTDFFEQFCFSGEHNDLQLMLSDDGTRKLSCHFAGLLHLNGSIYTEKKRIEDAFSPLISEWSIEEQESFVTFEIPINEAV
ncbi:Spo0B domain-containing protein [Salisediminibacterium halotolerans]|uniref:Stage 0 sporulation protein B (Sporulation initiation phosphotransferase) n=1 Tax=Salisediminibacterium halotolerans TaxID=517425 RepID=A0A1H9TFX3_9BACI|nr:MULTISPECIES: Spo0B domain-containing protein [Salisediminibacterium]RLJ78398.1 stage 0 sporulation protein B (sporulation initiation phosphotransferase) [Actinophytocola xinjiangensis]RPE85623.1 stage 0 sporulation protein B (sporulation initiation phosphotransferase) [Salisediminibacterium halotolerans]TWG37374.1 stage 0 sporulation protein B (sporulation initiation phosphotransferase) [Salisediminibacterium halotolerans]SER96041.1 stage 0 sporulation protein B (sporulation initiation phos